MKNARPSPRGSSWVAVHDAVIDGAAAVMVGAAVARFGSHTKWFVLDRITYGAKQFVERAAAAAADELHTHPDLKPPDVELLVARVVARCLDMLLAEKPPSKGAIRDAGSAVVAEFVQEIRGGGK